MNEILIKIFDKSFTKKIIKTTVSKFNVEKIHFAIKRGKHIQSFSDMIIDVIDLYNNINHDDIKYYYDITNMNMNEIDNVVKNIYDSMAECFMFDNYSSTTPNTMDPALSWTCFNCANFNNFQYVNGRLQTNVKTCKLCGITKKQSIIMSLRDTDSYAMIGKQQEQTPKCPSCDIKLILLNKDKFEEEKEDKEEQQDEYKECRICYQSYDRLNSLYRCKNGAIDEHKHGYYKCIKCISNEIEINAEKYQFDHKLDEDHGDYAYFVLLKDITDNNVEYKPSEMYDDYTLCLMEAKDIYLFGEVVCDECHHIINPSKMVYHLEHEEQYKYRDVCIQCAHNKEYEKKVFIIIEEAPECICGHLLRFKVVEENKESSFHCNSCKHTIKESRTYYYCDLKKPDHKNGYNVCIQCAYSTQKQAKKDELVSKSRTDTMNDTNVSTENVIDEDESKYDGYNRANIVSDVEDDETAKLIKEVMDSETFDLSCPNTTSNETCDSILKLVNVLISYKNWLQHIYKTSGNDSIERTINVNVVKHINNEMFKQIMIKSAESIKPFNKNKKNIKLLKKILENKDIMNVEIFMNGDSKQFANIMIFILFFMF